jgi:succinate dehydrogenase / fumarate reductase cytochrome b subunit
VVRTHHAIFLEALRYQGKENMLTWVLHRITGLGILLFVSTHVVAAFFLNALNDNISTAITAWYESRSVQVFVYFCVLYHAFNGLRVILEDFYPSLLRYHRELIWLQWAIFLPVFGLPALFMLQGIVFGSA